jgi:hypothetical protein
VSIIEFPIADLVKLKRLDEMDWDQKQEWDMELGKPHGVVGDNGYRDINGPVVGSITFANPPEYPEGVLTRAQEGEVDLAAKYNGKPFTPVNDLARYKEDKINPDHYRKLPMEAIEITEHFNFCLGNALKYIIRCEHKGDKKSDLAKAIWYLQRELARS